MLAFHLLGELVPQLGKIDPAEVYGEAFGMVFTSVLRADGLVDDLVQFLEHFGDVGRVPLLLELLVDRLDVVVPFGEDKGARFHHQRLESDEDLARHDLEPALGLVVRQRTSTASRRAWMRRKPLAPINLTGSNPSPLRWLSAASIACTSAFTSSSMGATISPPSLPRHPRGHIAPTPPAGS